MRPKTGFIEKVGRDMHGAFLKQAMVNAGVDMHALIEADDVFTTLAFVAPGPSGEREFSFCAQARRGHPASLGRTRPRDDPTHAHLSHRLSFRSRRNPREAQPTRLSTSRNAAGAVISYDPNYRASLWSGRDEAIRFMRSLIVTADIMKVSDEELPLLTGETDPEKAADVPDQGVKIVAITLGSEGAYVRVGKEHALVPGFHAKAVDTTGAGDSFFGGFLYRSPVNRCARSRSTMPPTTPALATQPPRSASSGAAEFPRCRSSRKCWSALKQ